MAAESEARELATNASSVSQSTQVNVEDIVERIRRALYLKGATALIEDESDHGDLSTVVNQPGQPAMPFDPEVYRSLHQARAIVQTGLQVDYQLGWRTPVIGHLWMAIRRRIHQEIRIYSDALMAKQSSFNAHLVRALTYLVGGLASSQLLARAAEVDTQAERIRDLQREVAELKERVAELERERLASPHTR